MAVSKTSLHPLTVIQHSFTENEVRQHLVDAAQKAMRAICVDTEERMKKCAENVNLLSCGVFYGNAYFKKLGDLSLKDRLDQLQKDGSFYHGKVSSTTFLQVQSQISPTGFEMNHFVLKKGVKATEGVQSLTTELSLLGSAEVCQVTQYIALRTVLGDEKFNALFAAESLTAMRISVLSSNNPINLLLRKFQNPKKTNFSKGDVVYFGNASMYDIKNHLGDYMGIVALCVDDVVGKEKFSTIGVSPDGATVQEIQNDLLKEFNADPIGDNIVTPNVASIIRQRRGMIRCQQAQALAKKVLSFQEFLKNGGGQTVALREFHVHRIKQLLDLSTSDARKLFSKWAIHEGVGIR
jgi:hypothetical protein